MEGCSCGTFRATGVCGCLMWKEYRGRSLNASDDDDGDVGVVQWGETERSREASAMYIKACCFLDTDATQLSDMEKERLLIQAAILGNHFAALALSVEMRSMVQGCLQACKCWQRVNWGICGCETWKEYRELQHHDEKEVDEVQGLYADSLRNAEAEEALAEFLYLRAAGIDHSRAVLRVHQAGWLGNCHALFELGMLYGVEHDLGVIPCRESAIMYAEQSALAGYPPGLALLANLVFDDSEEKFARAISTGDPYALGMYHRDARPDEAVRYFLAVRPSSAAYGWAQFEAGNLTKSSWRTSKGHWKVAAAQGLGCAMYALGRSYQRNGKNEGAFAWLSAAVAQHYGPAFGALARMHFNVEGKWKDWARAAYLLSAPNAMEAGTPGLSVIEFERLSQSIEEGRLHCAERMKELYVYSSMCGKQIYTNRLRLESLYFCVHSKCSAAALTFVGIFRKRRRGDLTRDIVRLFGTAIGNTARTNTIGWMRKEEQDAALELFSSMFFFPDEEKLLCVLRPGATT